MRPWKRRLSDDERSVLLSELLLRHPELVAEAEDIASTLVVVEDDQDLADEITARLRALHPSGPVSVDAGRARVLDVLQPYLDDLSLRKERSARRAAADIAIAVLLGLYECRDDTLRAAPLARPPPGSALGTPARHGRAAVSGQMPQIKQAHPSRRPMLHVAVFPRALIAGAIRSDGATVAAKLLLDAVSRERPPVSA